MKEMKMNNYTQNKRLFCDWTDRMYYSFHYRMLKTFVRHGMILIKFMRLFQLKKVSGWKNL